MADKANPANDTAALLGAGILVSAVALYHLANTFMEWIQVPNHQVIFVTVATPILTTGLYCLSRFRERKLEEKRRVLAVNRAAL